MRLRWMNNTYLTASHVPALTRGAPARRLGTGTGQESRRFGGSCQAEGGVVITLVIFQVR